ncbi:hypothetical protein BDZ85DRAFT_36300 [Elsinoe ampelina]|uniref:Uncharacterized protein n=1 Tax=Elsinoe ampelina TaxID=302913 RepID=A0A6A6G2D9_9PEZI|nr:hypothetical protein BDZ85DRAFT_36300 [Elsinoe ampelina]
MASRDMGSRLRGLKIFNSCSSTVLSDRDLTPHQHSLTKWQRQRLLPTKKTGKTGYGSPQRAENTIPTFQAEIDPPRLGPTMMSTRAFTLLGTSSAEPRLKQPLPSTPTPTMWSAGDFTLQVPIGSANRHIKPLPKNPPAMRRESRSLSHQTSSPVSHRESNDLNPAWRSCNIHSSCRLFDDITHNVDTANSQNSGTVESAYTDSGTLLSTDRAEQMACKYHITTSKGRLARPNVSVLEHDIRTWT